MSATPMQNKDVRMLHELKCYSFTRLSGPRHPIYTIVSRSSQTTQHRFSVLHILSEFVEMVFDNPVLGSAQTNVHTFALSAQARNPIMTSIHQPSHPPLVVLLAVEEVLAWLLHEVPLSCQKVECCCRLIFACTICTVN